MKGNFPTSKFSNIDTPFYFYDVDLLKRTLSVIQEHASANNITVHYAIKANANAKLLKIISSFGFGADCVSGNEVKAAIEEGFPADKIVFAGVGKTDREINTALSHDIFCFNAESIPELEVINELAGKKGKTARVELRVNPNVDAHTHHYITTGLSDNKFGFNLEDIKKVISLVQGLKNLQFANLKL